MTIDLCNKNAYLSYLRYGLCEAVRIGNERYTRRLNAVGRNDPCPCQSGKKYKKCCGKS